MADRADYYRVLHVRSDAPDEIIRASYRTLMQSLRLHPDLGGSHDRAAEINEAYAVLSDPEKRARYDRDIASARHGPEVPPPDPMGSRGTCLFCRAPVSGALARDPEALCPVCASPLGTARRHRLEHSMRRMLGRIPRDYAIRVHASWDGGPGLAARMENLSLNGMRFRCNRDFERGMLIKIDSDLCRAIGRVSYCRPDADGRRVVGVEFAAVKFPSARGTFVSEEI